MRLNLLGLAWEHFGRPRIVVNVAIGIDVVDGHVRIGDQRLLDIFVDAPAAALVAALEFNGHPRAMRHIDPLDAMLADVALAGLAGSLKAFPNPARNQSVRFAYTQWWYDDDPQRPPAGRVVATRRDHGTVENGHRFVIDFAGGKLGKVPVQEVLHGMVAVQGGDQVADVRDQHVVTNPHIGGWRLTFQVVPKTRDTIELRAYLKLGDEVLTETWSYAIVP